MSISALSSYDTDISKSDLTDASSEDGQGISGEAATAVGRTRNAGAELVAKMRKGNFRVVGEECGNVIPSFAPPTPSDTVSAALPASAGWNASSSPLDSAPAVCADPSLRFAPAENSRGSVAPRVFGAGLPQPTQSDFEAFVSTNAPEFMAAYAAQIANQPWKRQICWPALLFPIVWAGYRKMYELAAIIAVTPLVMQWLHAPPSLFRVVSAPALLLGWFGRRFYARRAQRKIAEIRASTTDEALALDAIRRAGGVSRAGAALGALQALCLVWAAFGPAIHR